MQFIIRLQNVFFRLSVNVFLFMELYFNWFNNLNKMRKESGEKVNAYFTHRLFAV